MKGRWLHRWRPRPAARLRLVLLPYAGGSAAAYRSWVAALPEWVEPIGVELPGHGARRGEAPVTTAGAVTAALAAELAGMPPAELVLFGHSMGGLLAFETARRMRERAGVPPAGLLISGFDAPWAPQAGRLRLPAPDDPRLLERLAGLGGVPSAVLADPALSSLLLPPLRADLELLRRYATQPGEPLGCPVRVYRGTGDPLTSDAGTRAWRRESDDFGERAFGGGHFYLQDEIAPLMAALAEDLAGIATPVTAAPARCSGSG
ncbi:putative thioesterase [Micromonospora arborensis]|uniref:Putative thioesterase n=1 Tax=Micromonospora arborensis TaxID=2116518 RepID=A0A318NL81_9ACTN|nr:alpha/beta fold hydrolase [Micromonospora arborensis]PYC71606.1 putative thioesterase [Micromonospora arborensis]